MRFLAFALLACASCAQDDFGAAVRVELWRRTGPGETKRIVLDDAAKIQALAKTIELKPKEACKCEHAEGAVFKTKGGEIAVSLCDHCFDVEGAARKYYSMPPAFLAAFRSHFKD